MSIDAKRLALTAIAGKLGCSPDSLRVWARQVQRDGGERPGQTSAEKARIKELEREVRELRQANEILKKGETLSAIGPRSRHWCAIGSSANGGGERVFCGGAKGSAAPLQRCL